MTHTKDDAMRWLNERTANGLSTEYRFYRHPGGNQNGATWLKYEAARDKLGRCLACRVTATTSIPVVQIDESATRTNARPMPCPFAVFADQRRRSRTTRLKEEGN